MPTISRSSPTTTSAVNQKRRPPLTPLATRLTSTTLSGRARPAEETVRSRRGGIEGPRLAVLERQPALAGAVGERLNTPVIFVAAAVEHGGIDAGRLGPLGEEGAGARRLLHQLQP